MSYSSGLASTKIKRLSTSINFVLSPNSSKLSLFNSSVAFTHFTHNAQMNITDKGSCSSGLRLHTGRIKCFQHFDAEERSESRHSILLHVSHSIVRHSGPSAPVCGCPVWMHRELVSDKMMEQNWHATLASSSMLPQCTASIRSIVFINQVKQFL